MCRFTYFFKFLSFNKVHAENSSCHAVRYFFDKLLDFFTFFFQYRNSVLIPLFYPFYFLPVDSTNGLWHRIAATIIKNRVRFTYKCTVIVRICKITPQLFYLRFFASVIRKKFFVQIYSPVSYTGLLPPEHCSMYAINLHCRKCYR